jgi:hypothetical protein
MKRTYTILELIEFWRRQSKENYKVIEAIVNLVEFQTEHLSDAEKMQVIIDTLRKFGLFEIEYDGDRSFESKEFIIPEKPEESQKDISWEKKPFEVQIEIYYIQILDKIVEFAVYMN